MICDDMDDEIREVQLFLEKKIDHWNIQHSNNFFLQYFLIIKMSISSIRQVL